MGINLAMSAKLKVLIADDEPSLRLLVRATLQANPNYELFEACDGDEALEFTKKENPDVLLLDIMMPGKSGFEVCEKIKQDDELKSTVVIMLTAKGQQTDKDWAKSVGANHFLTKPFSPMELLKLVDEMSGSGVGA